MRLLKTIGIRGAAIFVLATLPEGISRHESPACNAQATSSATPSNGLLASSILKSIGDEVSEASAIVYATVECIGAPTWNSPDGTDWTDEWMASPRKFHVSPAPAIPVDMRVTNVVLTKESSLPTDVTPQVAPGDLLRVFFFGTTLRPNEASVFFLAWTHRYMSDGSAPLTWYCDEFQGSWHLMDDGTWLPMSRMQSFQLVRAATMGVGGIEVVNGYGRATDEGLADIVTREAQTTEVDVAGFEQWPYQAARNASQDAQMQTPAPAPPP